MADTPRIARRRLTLLAFAAALLALVTPAARAQEFARDNAALWYQRAIDAFQQIPPAEIDLVSAYVTDPQGPPSPAVRAAIRRANAALGYLRRGSEMGYDDLHLDYSQGFDLLLPHLSPMRQLGRFAQADALAHLYDGDVHTATDRIATIYRMSGHIVSDRVLISSLVGQVIFQGADNVLQQVLDRGVLDPADSANLLGAIQQVDNGDAFGYVESLMMEQVIAVEWLGKTLGDQDQRLNSADQLEWLVNDAEDAQALAAMTDEQFQDNLARYDDVMNDIVETFMMDDKEAARARLDDIVAGLEAGDYGVLASIILPSFSRLFDKKEEAEQLLADRVATLSGLVNGEIKPEEEANAALYYLRAIDVLARIMSRDTLARVREQEAHPERDIDDAFRSELESCAKAIDVLREGSMKRRCDFTLYRHRDDAALLPEYAGGLREELRLLYVDALRLEREGRLDDAVDRLAIMYRMTAHLSGDDPLVIPLIAHAAFTKAESLTPLVMHRDGFTDIHRWQLFDAVDAIPLRDPFGYIGSIVKGRAALAKEIRDRSPFFHNQDAKSITDASEHWNGDQLLYLAAIFDTLKRSGSTEKDDTSGADADTGAKAKAAPAPDTSRDDELEALADLLDPAALEAVRDDVPLMAPMIARGDLAFFDGRSIPAFARYVERQRRARADLRDVLARLRPDMTEAEK